ncbi:MAG: hypothetical protein CGW95_02370 [Phenylobacterium zucineum]|nr:MAG: hypothetical protein CGW95_02370 [Phenylobacterium zucineum]
MDAFSWVRPWVPYGEDAFVWHDPAEDMKPVIPTTEPSESQDRPARSERPDREDRAPADAAVEAESLKVEDDIWVELPLIEEKPKRSRTRRGRDTEARPGAEVSLAETEIEAMPAVEPAADPAVASAPVVETAPGTPATKPPRARRSRTSKVEIVDPPIAAEPALVMNPEPEAVKEAPKPMDPDPAEISAPPASPRRGWWRR